MNYEYCTECGTKLLYTDANCHKCPTDPDISNLPTLKFELTKFDTSPLTLKLKKAEKGIKIIIQEVAKRSGIKNAYQLQKQTGFHPSKAANIWNEKWRNIDLYTLNTLCNVLNCTPNDILQFTPVIEDVS